MVKIAACKVCSSEFEYEPFILNGQERQIQTVCDRCEAEAEKNAEEEAMRRKARALESKWDEICPPAFANTDPKRVPGDFLKVVEDWIYQAICIGLVGEAGLCKTRAAYLLLKRMHFAGKRVHAITAMQLERAAVEQFSDDSTKKYKAIEELRLCKSCDLLLIDDLGKGVMRERAEMELFDILDYRTSNMRPTAWTANASGEDLRSKLSKDRGVPIMRRLVEFSKVTKLQARA